MQSCAGSSIKTRATKTLYSLTKTPGSVLVLKEVLSEGWKLSKLCHHEGCLSFTSLIYKKDFHGVLKCTVVYFLLFMMISGHTDLAESCILLVYRRDLQSINEWNQTEQENKENSNHMVTFNVIFLLSKSHIFWHKKTEVEFVAASIV